MVRIPIYITIARFTLNLVITIGIYILIMSGFGLKQCNRCETDYAQAFMSAYSYFKIVMEQFNWILLHSIHIHISHF